MVPYLHFVLFYLQYKYKDISNTLINFSYFVYINNSVKNFILFKNKENDIVILFCFLFSFIIYLHNVSTILLSLSSVIQVY